MRDATKPLAGSRTLGIGPRQALREEQAIAYGRHALQPALYPVLRQFPARSRALAQPLIRAALRWGFDLPGPFAHWGLLHTMSARMYDVLDVLSQGVWTHGRSGAARYAFIEQLPAALLACLCVDTFAALSQYTVQILDARTDVAHRWTMWNGPLLPALLAHQTRGILPSYVVIPQASALWLPERIALATWLIPETFWNGLDICLKRMVVTYIAEPAETLTLLHALLHGTSSAAVTYLDILLMQCLRGKVGVNKIPGQVFVLPELTFCAQTRVLQALSEETGESADDILMTLRTSRLALPELQTLTLAPDTSRPRPVVLRGFCVPHGVLHMRCVSFGTTYDALPWASHSPTLYTGSATLHAAMSTKENVTDVTSATA